MNDTLAREALIRSCQRVLLRILLDGSPIVTADNIREEVALPSGVNPKTFGSVPTSLADAGIIMRIGHVQTERPIAHKRHISVWRLRDRVAAEKWLTAHPEITPPEKPEQQGRLSLLSTSYCVGLLADGLDCNLVPNAIRSDVEDIRGRLTDIVVQLDHLAQE